MTEEEQKLKKKGPPFQILPNKQILPLLGIGTSRYQDQAILTNILKKGLQLGLRHIDTARLYNIQIPLGNAIRRCIKQGRCKREDLFISTKTFAHKDLNPVFQLKQALRLMGLKYVDVYYMHWPLVDIDSTGKVEKGWNHRPLQQYWKDMQQCIRKGYTKHIAVSNFNGQLLLELLSVCKIKPIINQIQVHPYLQQSSLVQLCQKNNVTVIAHTPLARGNSCQIEDVNLLKDEVINDVAAKYSKSPAQIVLKFNLMRNVGVIPRTSNVDRLKQNLESWNIQMTEQDMKKIRNIQKSVRVSDGAHYFKSFSCFD